jgi:hypothetical protein
MQLERDTAAFYMNIATLPAGVAGETAPKFMTEQIDTKAEHIEDITQWFQQHPSPSKC